jgi:heme/copper-type cytochrome/quinol oxidase subunit 2
MASSTPLVLPAPPNTPALYGAPPAPPNTPALYGAPASSIRSAPANFANALDASLDTLPLLPKRKTRINRLEAYGKWVLLIINTLLVLAVVFITLLDFKNDYQPMKYGYRIEKITGLEHTLQVIEDECTTSGCHSSFVEKVRIESKCPPNNAMYRPQVCQCLKDTAIDLANSTTPLQIKKAKAGFEYCYYAMGQNYESKYAFVFNDRINLLWWNTGVLFFSLMDPYALANMDSLYTNPNITTDWKNIRHIIAAFFGVAFVVITTVAMGLQHTADKARLSWFAFTVFILANIIYWANYLYKSRNEQEKQEKAEKLFNNDYLYNEQEKHEEKQEKHEKHFNDRLSNIANTLCIPLVGVPPFVLAVAGSFGIMEETAVWTLLITSLAAVMTAFACVIFNKKKYEMSKPDSKYSADKERLGNINAAIWHLTITLMLLIIVIAFSPWPQKTDSSGPFERTNAIMFLTVGMSAYLLPDRFFKQKERPNAGAKFLRQAVDLVLRIFFTLMGIMP